MITVTNKYGVVIDFEIAVNFMDDGIRERLYNFIAPCSEQDFFEAYCLAHECRFNEPFELAKENPVY